MNNIGAFHIARNIFENELWNKPSWWLKVWIYILWNVNYDNTEKMNKWCNFFSWEKIFYECNLSKEGIKVKSIFNVIEWLVSKEKITTQKTTRWMLITVLNYAKYQDLINYKNDTEKANSRTTQRQVNDTIKEEVKNKEENNIIDKSIIISNKLDINNEIYISWFIDWEWCFYVWKYNNTLIFSLSVKLREDDEDILKLIQKTLWAGNIYDVPSERQKQFRLQWLKNIKEFVIPFFERNPLKWKKRKDYELFKEIVFNPDKYEENKLIMNSIIKKEDKPDKSLIIKEDKRILEIDIILETIKSKHWTIDWTIKEQRQYGNLLKDKLEKIKWFNWDYWWFISYLIENTDEYSIWQTTSPKNIYYNLGKLIAKIKTKINKEPIFTNYT